MCSCILYNTIQVEFSEESTGPAQDGLSLVCSCILYNIIQVEFSEESQALLKVGCLLCAHASYTI